MLTFDTLESVGIKMYVEKKRKIDFNNEALEIIQSNFYFILFICIHLVYMENTHIVMKRKLKAERFKLILFSLSFSNFFLYFFP
jgi:hypothetical protein